MTRNTTETLNRPTEPESLTPPLPAISPDQRPQGYPQMPPEHSENDETAPERFVSPAIATLQNEQIAIETNRRETERLSRLGDVANMD